LIYFFLVEEENYLEVDLVASPLHIKPEWYFLFLYSVLRRVPRKVVGVLLRGGIIALTLVVGSRMLSIGERG